MTLYAWNIRFHEEKTALRWFNSNAHIKHTFIVVILCYYTILRVTGYYTTSRVRKRQETRIDKAGIIRAKIIRKNNFLNR